MQEPRRRRRLEQRLLSLSAAALVLALGCAHSTGARSAGAPNEGSAQAEGGEGGGADSVAAQTNSRPRRSTPPAPAELPRGTLVLHVGDSFAGALGVPLGQRLKARGLRSVLEFRTSSYVPTWASGTELPLYVARYNPDLVIVTLGANEFELANPEQRASSVRKLVRVLGGRPCVWVSPPRWKQDTGILAVIRANVKPCRYLDSDSVVHDVPRKRDKIHPNDAGRELWADAVLAWLIRERRPDGARPWDFKEEAP
jgi:lysophospholipase L1-like esterase